MDLGSDAPGEVRKYLTLVEEYGAQARKNATGHVAGSGDSGIVYAQLATANALSAVAAAIVLLAASGASDA
ncbi:hypothetical protein [Paractinoplanes rishiriensis]|uniref:Uncharacterized protein n=1 Tax=Paractinoplanes rishiriensis TaxID=1050105 RepID=A0A919K8X8_9ACTN|nr:hypothetical protein [Actinoplanes rishiriensis]GIF01006.1 hypothetical protein Ari01nite_84700 [Actinoplanes rishiriensis]